MTDTEILPPTYYDRGYERCIVSFISSGNNRFLQGSSRADATAGPIGQPDFVVKLKTGLGFSPEAQRERFQDNLPLNTPIYVFRLQ